jgi:hypothetical protein
MRPRLEMYSVDEILEKLPELEKKWATIRNEHKNTKQIEAQFKTLKNLLKRAQILSNQNSWIDELHANEKYLILRNHLSKNEIPYHDFALSAPQSDKIKVFIEHCNKFTDQEYWQELALAYTQQNYKKIPYKTYYNLFSADKQHREALMTPEQIDFLANLPNKITIYRGGSVTEQKTKRYGISWTLKREIAEQFANVKTLRDKKEMVVIEKEIDKSEAIAYFNQRQEEEIIYISN